MTLPSAADPGGRLNRVVFIGRQEPRKGLEVLLADADHLASIMRGLPPLTCVLYSKQFPCFDRVTIDPYFERQA